MRKNTFTDMSKRVEKITESGCWVWMGFVDKDGYGQASFEGRSVKPHRLFYEKTIGPIPEGHHLDHLCRVRCCVNPAHLEPVTPAENLKRSGPYRVKTHCINGHEFTSENTITIKRKRGGQYRMCRICNKAKCKQFHNRRK